jgi:NAD(P)-dependent dehydrogenase (short-subunit alcohol dehydrogenase family)
MEREKVAVVVGVGPGLGAAVAGRFAREGYALGLMARTAESAAPVRAAIEERGGKALAVSADAGDPASVAAAFAEVRRQLGPVDVLVYNAGAFRMAEVMDVTPDQFEQAWRVGCFGGFLSAREVVPGMLERGRGTLLFTGATASLRGGARFSCLAVGKFGLRALAQSLARELGPRGVHVAHVIIDGQIDTPRWRAMSPGRDANTMLSPEAIAETYWQLHAQDRTAWTHELDLRPAVEKF